ncbi:cytochrome P450 [Microbaculum marinum]|uniref:Cytochrome P450 n=1 Tax=Microbaculum marinum TaxID=1764581 RepID=A0AAW9RZX8_9HYPH
MSAPIPVPPPVVVSDPAAAVDVLRDRGYSVANIGSHLDRLEEATGEDFATLREVIQSSLIYQSGSGHLQTRRVLAKFFGERSISEWSDAIDAEIEAQVGRLAASRSPDLVRDFTDPLFAGIIGRLIGCRPGPATDLVDMVARTRVLTEPLLSLRQMRSMQAALGEIMALVPTEGFDPDVRPRPLAQVIAEDEPPVPDGVSIVATIATLVFAAHTMAESLAFALWGLLSREPALWEDAATDGWRERQLERLLSLYPSTLYLYRVADRDGEVAGCPVHAGQTVTLHMPAINDRIRARAADAGQTGECPLKAGQIMSFGTGAHKCPGEALARLVIGRAVPALAGAFPRLTLEREAVRFLRTHVIQTPSALPCDLWSRNEKAGSKLWQVKTASAARRIVTDDDAFGPPQMVDHLTALASSGGLDLDVAIRMARNALFFLSGERHDTARRLVAHTLGGSRIADWEPHVAATIGAAIVSLSAVPKPDLVSDFSEPLCRVVNRHVLGLHPTDLDRFDRLAPEFHKLLEPMLSLREILELQEVMAETIALVPLEAPAGEGMPKGLLQALVEARHPEFDPEDGRALALILYGAGFNMAHTLSNALHWILSLPAEDRRGVHESAWIADRMETILSLLGGPKFIYRMARRDVEIDGMAFAARDTARIHLAQVNRALPSGHLSFGRGLHHCVGAALTRLTLKLAIPALFRRHPDLALEPQAHVYSDYSQSVALKSLKCRKLSP